MRFYFKGNRKCKKNHSLSVFIPHKCGGLLFIFCFLIILLSKLILR